MWKEEKGSETVGKKKELDKKGRGARGILPYVQLIKRSWWALGSLGGKRIKRGTGKPK